MWVIIISIGVFIVVTGGVYLFTETATKKQPALTDRLDRITGSFTQAELTGAKPMNSVGAVAAQTAGMWDTVTTTKQAAKGATPWQKESDSEAVYANIPEGNYVPFSKQKVDSLPGISNLISTTNLATNLRRDILRAGLKLRPAELLALYLGSGIGCALIGLALFKSPYYGLGLGVIGLMVPNFFIKFKQTSRKAAFERQLPDILTLLSSSLRTGFSFTNAIQMVVNEAPAPASEEFGVTLAETSLGVGIETSLERMVERTNSYDLDLMATAVTIQLQVGGNLAEILDTISATIRKRAELRMEIASLTAEGKLSGVILFLMPIVLAMFIYARQPTYFTPMLTDPMGGFIIGGTLFLQIIGGILIRNMVNIDV
jgi:tight adherence protein B